MGAQDSTDAIGIIVGVQAGCVVVQLPTEDRVLCRSVTRLHRPLGFLTFPYGRRARISYSNCADKRPLLVEILEE